MYIPISPPSFVSLPPSLSHPSRWSQSTELISLCYVAASHQLSILHLVVFISPCHSLTSSQLTLPPPCVLKSIFIIDHSHMYSGNAEISSRLQAITRDSCFSDIHDSNASILLRSQSYLYVTSHGNFLPSATKTHTHTHKRIHTRTNGIKHIKIYHWICLDFKILKYFHFLHFFSIFYDILTETILN